MIDVNSEPARNVTVDDIVSSDIALAGNSNRDWWINEYLKI